MSKLQEISRPNGTKVHFAYLPEDFLETLDWHKGDELKFEITEPDLSECILIRRVKL